MSGKSDSPTSMEFHDFPDLQDRGNKDKKEIQDFQDKWKACRISAPGGILLFFI